MSNKSDQRVLFFNPYGIGDVLFSLPLVAAVKQRGCFISYVCNRRAFEVLKNHPAIDNIIIYERDEIKGSLKKFITFFKQLCSAKATIAVDLTLNRNLSFLLMCAGIKKRVGFDYRSRGLFLTQKKKLIEFTRNVAEEFFDLYYLIFDSQSKIEPKLYYPEISLNDKEKNFAELLFFNLGLNKTNVVISIFPGGGASWGKDWKKKHWPGKKFLELIVKLLNYNSGLVIMIMGDAADKEALTLPTVLLRSRRCFDLRGKLTLRESMSIIKASKLVVSNDGGPAHLSAALGTNLVSIMGPVSDIVYKPFGEESRIHVMVSDLPCRPCYRFFRMPDCKNGFECLNSISVEGVFDKICSLL